MALKIEDLVNAGDLADAVVAIAVSVTAGLVVALLTAPHSPPFIRVLRRKLRALRRSSPPPEASPTPANTRSTPAPPSPAPVAITQLPLPPPPSARTGVLRGEPSESAPGDEHHEAHPPTETPGPETGAESLVDMQRASPSEPQRLLVRLLGPIEVDAVQLREKSVAVLAFLAVHRTASADTLEDACWASPSKARSRKRLKDVVSECRGTVGIEHLPHAAAGIYTVGPNVITDLDLFERALDRAKLETGLERAGHLQSALDLVRGRIFAYPSRSTPSFGWVDLENLVSHWELRIEEVARECALLFSDAGQVRDSVAVLLRFLEVLPLNVGLTEALMTVHAAAGERRAVETVFRAHVQGLARIHDCEPECTTVDLRAELLAQTRHR